MPAMRSKWSLKHAAINGAVAGAAVLLINLYFQGQLLTTGIPAVAMMMLGGALGGAVLFLFVAFVGNSFIR
jgi:hypothetical protein